MAENKWGAVCSSQDAAAAMMCILDIFGGPRPTVPTPPQSSNKKKSSLKSLRIPKSKRYLPQNKRYLSKSKRYFCLENFWRFKVFENFLLGGHGHRGFKNI